MKCPIFLVFFLIAPSVSFGAGLEIPWSEVKDLIRKEVLGEIEPEKVLEKEEEKGVVSLQHVQTSLSLSEKSAKALISMKVKIEGNPGGSLLLWKEGMVLSRVIHQDGVDLEAREEGLFLNSTTEKEGKLELEALIPIDVEQQKPSLSLFLPPALVRQLKISDLGPWKLEGKPGLSIQGPNHFLLRPGPEVGINLHEKGGEVTAEEERIEFNLISRLMPREDHLLVETLLIPLRTHEGELVLKMPAGAQISKVQSSEKFLTLEGESWIIRAGVIGRKPLSFFWKLPLDATTSGFEMPMLKDNLGQEGLFTVQPVQGAKTLLEPRKAWSEIRGEDLSADLQNHLPTQGKVYVKRPKVPLILRVLPMKLASTTTWKVPVVDISVQFSEEGGVMKVVEWKMDANGSSHIRVERLPGAELWEFRLNNKKEQVYLDENGDWLLPILPGGSSHLRLAFTEKESPFKIHGTIESRMPSLDLAARRIQLAVSLPERVDLVSFEGPMTPSVSARRPKGSVGKVYSFHRDFFRGEAMDLQLSYKEPLNN